MPTRIENNYFPEGSVKRTAGYFVPGLGSYLSVEDAINEPSWSNIGAAGLSVGGDLLSIFGVGNAMRTANAASKAAKASSKILNKVYKAADVTHMAYNDAVKATYNASKTKQGVNAASLMKVSPNMAIKLLRKANLAQEIANAKNARYFNLNNYYNLLLHSNSVTQNAGFILKNKAKDARLVPYFFTPTFSFGNGAVLNIKTNNNGKNYFSKINNY